MILISKSALKESKEGTSVMVWNWYRRKMEAAFLLFICLGIFAACGTPQSEPQSAPCPTPAASDAPPDYSFAVPAEQCAVCGTCPQLAISALWGHENIAFLDLNTFDVLELPINRYAPRGPLLEQPAGFSAVVSANLGGASLTFLAAPDRGMASGWLEWHAPARLCPQQAGQFLCECSGGNAAGPCRRAFGRKAHCAAERGGRPASDGGFFPALPTACRYAAGRARSGPGGNAGVPVPAPLWGGGHRRAGLRHRTGGALHNSPKCA